MGRVNGVLPRNYGESAKRRDGESVDGCETNDQEEEIVLCVVDPAMALEKPT